MEELLIEGEKIGVKKGIEIGREKGRLECRIETVIKILKHRFKKIPAATVRAIRSRKDLIALNSLIDRALDCETLFEFEWILAYC
ncbi:MAG: hypothetical protein LBT09_13205 [Planctomycetaceae bacterium]|jgi:predicted transposase YdaD|nr:hypothetical protein [Planctomycetaceae bacterium]